jgi:hypothetical protein
MEAEIVLDYGDPITAKAIARAISPDNVETPRGLAIKTDCRERRVITKIECREKLSTFIATIDDLLFCASTAEKAVQAIAHASETTTEFSKEQ